MSDAELIEVVQWLTDHGFSVVSVESTEQVHFLTLALKRAATNP